MTKLPAVSGDEAIKAFRKAGFRESRQRGSHVMMLKTDWPYVLTVPRHKELAMGTLRQLIRKSGLSVEAFLAYL